MKTLIIVALLTASTLTYSQDTTKKDQMEEVQEKKDTTNVNPSDKYTRVVVDESKMNRENVKYTADFNLTGQMLQSQATGINLGYFKDLNNIIYLSFFNLDTDGHSWVDEELDDGYMIEVALKHFTGNSFYIRPSLYLRSQQFADDEEYDTASNSYLATDITDYQTIGIGFNIGNQWQWENFTLGCNWIGIRKDITTLNKDGPGTDGYNEVSAELLNFYLGASF
jgi:hypothetical protein